MASGADDLHAHGFVNKIISSWNQLNTMKRNSVFETENDINYCAIPVRTAPTLISSNTLRRAERVKRSLKRAGCLLDVKVRSPSKPSLNEASRADERSRLFPSLSGQWTDSLKEISSPRENNARGKQKYTAAIEQPKDIVSSRQPLKNLVIDPRDYLSPEEMENGGFYISLSAESSPRTISHHIRTVSQVALKEMIMGNEEMIGSIGGSLKDGNFFHSKVKWTCYIN
ncbi:LADA_0F12200g1_1 [Lachancea dasiensis]|uniref:LADA_0F12200g1_1 n=1 Tax=Lachancea dasiensis TaxID=1072105 RepID=A0A1G4JMZ4_9SACH|nr:LADA_0F12200g1_1 [Lachancea dasiensis]